MGKLRPTADNISFAEEVWQKLELDKVDEIVKQAFCMWSNHKDLGQIKAKIGVLNALWEAGVLDVGGWAWHIRDTASKPDFHIRLLNGDKTLVREVAKYNTSQQEKPRSNWVAASKYLHFSNPRGFPVWDSMAVYAAKYLNGTHRPYSRTAGNLEVKDKKVKNKDFADYEGWCALVDRLCDMCGCQGDYKAIDQYLWLLGYAALIDGGTDSSHWLVGKLRGQDWRKLLPQDTS